MIKSGHLKQREGNHLAAMKVVRNQIREQKEARLTLERNSNQAKVFDYSWQLFTSKRRYQKPSHSAKVDTPAQFKVRKYNEFTFKSPKN